MKIAIGLIHRLSSNPRFDVTVEATHHGPITDVPCFFIEVGSGPEEWGDPVAGRTIAEAIARTVGMEGGTGPVGVGFGGPHYSKGFTDLLLNTNSSISHIVAKHSVPDVDEDMLRTLFRRSLPGAQYAVIDWKGIRGDDRKVLLGLLEGLGIQYLRLRRLLSDSKR